MFWIDRFSTAQLAAANLMRRGVVRIDGPLGPRLGIRSSPRLREAKLAAKVVKAPRSRPRTTLSEGDAPDKSPALSVSVLHCLCLSCIVCVWTDGHGQGRMRWTRGFDSGRKDVRARILVCARARARARVRSRVRTRIRCWRGGLRRTCQSSGVLTLGMERKRGGQS